MFRLPLVCLLLTAPACAELGSVSAPSPSDPAAFDTSMFDEQALAGYDDEERAYIKGHAIAVYLYGKTLPAAIGHKGYPYEPGISGSEARVPYAWADVMVARSGGTDGTGALFNAECPAGDDVCQPGEPQDPPDDPFVDEDCEEFLDPAAMDARALTAKIPMGQVLDRNELTASTHFARGLAEALYLEDLDEDTEFSEIELLKDDVQDYGMCEHSPLILDLDGDGIDIGAVGDGVRFDLRARGGAVATAWPRGDDALLVLDWDRDGAIASGAELFGNNAGFADGFEALAVIDARSRGGNADGVVDSRDALFERLQVWRDLDRDGVSQPEELSSLAAVGVHAIRLDAHHTRERDRYGNSHRRHGVFVRAGGGGGAVVDVWLRYRR